MNPAEVADRVEGGEVQDLRAAEELTLDSSAGVTMIAGQDKVEPVETAGTWIDYVLAAVTALVGGHSAAPALTLALAYTVEMAVESLPGRSPLEDLLMVCGLGFSAWTSYLLCGALVGAVMPRGWQAAALVGGLPVWLVARMWPLLTDLPWQWTWNPYIMVWAVVAIFLATPFVALAGGYVGARWWQGWELSDDAILDDSTIAA